jgi:hypothetical protein
MRIAGEGNRGNAGFAFALIARDQESSHQPSDASLRDLLIALHLRKNFGSMQFGVFQM